MTEFAYNNAMNINISYISFKFNCRYYFHIFYKKNINLYSKLKVVK